MAFGIIDTSYIDFPSNIDSTYIKGLTLRSGLQFSDLVGRVDAAMGEINAGLDPVMASLLAPPTTSEVARGGANGRFKATRKSQYTVARPQTVERAAHGLAIDEWEIALGFTEDGLQEISLDDFQAQLDAVRLGFEAARRGETLGRLFSDAEVSVQAGTVMTSPGFAGSGTGGNVFNTAYPNGNALGAGYTHYFRDTDANRALVIATAVDRLALWGPGTFELIGSSAAITAISLLPLFVAAGSALVRPAPAAAEALVDPLAYAGVYRQNIRVRRPITDFTEDVFAIYRSGGAFSPSNPLVWRYDALRGRDAYVRSREMFPLAGAYVMQKFGANVHDRTGAALIKIAASGAYVAPVITV